MMPKIKLLIIIILITFYTGSYAQEAENQNNGKMEFQLALNLYESGQYQDALQLLDKIINRENLTSRTTVATLFKAESLLQLKKYDEAKKILDDFIHEFPGSRYINEARVVLTKINLEQNNYLDAFRELLTIIVKSDSSNYIKEAKAGSEKIALNYLTLNQIKSISDTTRSQNLKAYLLLLSGKMYLSNGNYDSAKIAFDNTTKLYPGTDEALEAGKLLQIKSDKTDSTFTETPLIGVMLPISKIDSGDVSDASSEILAGIKFAISNYNQTHDSKIGLLIRNTERKREQIEKIKDEIINIPRVKVIVGPIYSDEVRETLDAFKDTDIPIISPTATENGLTDKYPNFFQANPSFAIRGKVMAQYIYYVENKRKMAVLNAIDGYSPLLANAFVEEFKELGGEILTEQSYRSNSFELSDQVSQIAADSLVLDGVYLPLADKRDVPAILSQFVQHNLNVPIYGNQDWFLAKGYETSPELSDKLTFTSDFYIDFNNNEYKKFSENFLNITNIDANRNVLYGYDMAEYLLDIVHNFNSSRDIIKKELESGKIFRGFHNNIFFDQNRVNKFLNIVRYRDGKFELVDKFKASK